MPRIRLLADLASATPGIMGADAAQNPVYDVAPGDTVPVVLDATGWAADDSITGSDWWSPDSVTITADTLTGNEARCNVAVPNVWPYCRRAYLIQNTMTLDTGVVRKTNVWLRATGR